MRNRTYAFIKAIGEALMEAARAAVDLVIPRECIVCGRTLKLYERHLCLYCEADLPLTYYWDRRRNPMADKVNALIQKRITEEILSEENTGKPPGNHPVQFSYAAALFFYHGENRYKRIPQRLKYLGDIEEGRFFSGMLGEYLHESALFRDIDMIIPVPLHWSRRWSRGYNQAEVVARAIAQKLGGVPVRTDILVRSRRTRTQTKLDVDAKSGNVHGAFALGKHKTLAIKGIHHVLLIDDVFTTGATMAACLSVLQPFFGPEVRISCATLGFVNNG